MTSLGYDSYQSYRQETNRRTPHTEERHKAKLDKKLSVLYRQKDYRALELIMELADTLLSDEDTERTMDIYFTASHLPKADRRHLEFCKAFLR